MPIKLREKKEKRERDVSKYQGSKSESTFNYIWQNKNISVLLYSLKPSTNIDEAEN